MGVKKSVSIMEAGADMGYMEDTGNHDVRTEEHVIWNDGVRPDEPETGI